MRAYTKKKLSLDMVASPRYTFWWRAPCLQSEKKDTYIVKAGLKERECALDLFHFNILKRGKKKQKLK